MTLVLLYAIYMNMRNKRPAKKIETLRYDTEQAVGVFDQVLEQKLRNKPETVRAMARTVFQDVLEKHRTYGVALATAVESLDGFLDEGETFRSVENDYWNAVRASDEGSALSDVPTESLGASYRQGEDSPFWLRDTRKEKKGKDENVRDGSADTSSGSTTSDSKPSDLHSKSTEATKAKDVFGAAGENEKAGNTWRAKKFNQASRIFHTLTDTAILKLFETSKTGEFPEHRVSEALKDKPDKHDISFAKGGWRAVDYFVGQMDEFTGRWGKSIDDPNAEGGRRNNVNYQAIYTLYDTTSYMEQKSQGIKPPITKMIYLNPRPQDAAVVFPAAMEALESANVSARGKIHGLEVYPKHYAKRKADYKSGKIKFSAKRDMMVLYTTEEEADAVLGIIKDIYDRHSTAFEGRATPWAPVRINDGIAVGDEPDIEGESLTSHRAMIVGQALEAAEAYIAESGKNTSEVPDKDKVAIFRTVLSVLAKKNGINPRNIAFADEFSGGKRGKKKSRKNS